MAVPATRPGWPVRRLLGLAALAVTVGAGAYGFARVNRPENCFRRALAAAARDDFDTTQYELLRLQGRPEYEPHAALISGILLLQERKSNDALDEFQVALGHRDTRALALTLAGRTLLLQRKFATGERMLHFALMEDPNLVEAHRVLGAAYFDVGDNRGALEHLSKAAELSPNDPRTYQLLAMIHRTTRSNEEAMDDLRKSLQLGAADPERLPAGLRQKLLLDLAQMQEEELLHEQALATLSEADDTADALALRGECHYSLGDLKAARDCTARALRLDGDHFGALLAQGRLAMDANDSVAAEKSYRRALELRPLDAKVNYAFSQVLYRLGQDELAHQHAEKAAESRERYQEYTDAYKLLWDDPRNPEVRFRMGLLSQRLGKDDEAAGWYHAVLLLDPEHAKARERLSQLPGGLDGTGEQP